MAYFYVKSGGTATGDAGRYATQQTGSFAGIGAAGYYDTLSDALAATTAPADGDFICVSSSHAESGTANVTWTPALDESASEVVSIVSVSDTNCDTYSPRTSADSVQFDYSSGLYDIGLGSNIHSFGIYYKPGDDFHSGGNNSVQVTDGVIHLTSAGATIRSVSNGPMIFNNVEFVFGDDDVDGFEPGSSGYLEVNGGSVVCTDANPGRYVSDLPASGDLILRGVDLSGIDSTSHAVVNVMSGANRSGRIVLEGCKIAASKDLLGANPGKLGLYFSATNTAATSAAAEYQFFFAKAGGAIEDDTAIIRDESVAFPSGTKVSAIVTTEADVQPNFPLRFQLPARYIAPATDGDTLTVYLASTATLHTDDVWVNVIYPDGTNGHQFNRYDGSYSDPLTVSTTALTTDAASTWKNGASDLTGYNEYKIDLDLSGDPPGNGVPIIEINVGIPSTVIYFDTSIGVS